VYNTVRGVPQVSQTTRNTVSSDRRRRDEAHANILPEDNQFLRKKQQPMTSLDRRRLEGAQECLAMKKIIANVDTFIGREQQIRDKRLQQDRLQQWDQRYHEMMEENRVKAVIDEHDKFEAKIKRNHDFGMHLAKQMDERQERRLRQQDERELEAMQYQKMCELHEAEERAKLAKKQADARLRMAELQKGNELVSREKAHRQLIEKRNDMQILRYQQSKAIAEQHREEEKQRIRHQKDLEYGEMLKKQERSIDRRSEEDEQRMIAAFYQKEKIYRQQKAKKEAQKKRDMEELKEGWRQQILDKAVLLARQANQDRIETAVAENSVYMQQMKLEEEYARKRESAMANRAGVEAQIAKKTQAKYTTRRVSLEKRNVETDAANAVRQVNQLREETIADMKKRGVPRKYWSKLENPRLGMARDITATSPNGSGNKKGADK
jgi:hypothetical protein